MSSGPSSSVPVVPAEAKAARVRECPGGSGKTWGATPRAGLPVGRSGRPAPRPAPQGSALRVANPGRSSPAGRNASCSGRQMGTLGASARPCYLTAMETKPPIPLAVLVGIQTPEVDDVAHEASLEELGRLVKTLGYGVAGTVSQRREGTGAGSVLGSGKLAELATLTGGTGLVGSMAPPPKSKARQRFEGAAETTPAAGPGAGAAPQPELVIVDHELSPSQIRNLERATGARVLD